MSFSLGIVWVGESEDYLKLNNKIEARTLIPAHPLGNYCTFKIKSSAPLLGANYIKHNKMYFFSEYA